MFCCLDGSPRSLGCAFQLEAVPNRPGKSFAWVACDLIVFEELEPGVRAQVVERLHEVKTAAYEARLTDGALRLRPVLGLNWRLNFAAIGHALTAPLNNPIRRFMSRC